MKKRLVAMIMAFVMLFGSAPIGALVGLDFGNLFGVKASAADHSVGDFIEFGSYPQSEVTDSATLSALNSLSKTWVSYGYYSGTGSYGTMVPGDWMKHADVTYHGSKYRAVTFTQYRPNYTYHSSSASDSYQDNNGYNVNTTYWFKYEPLKWRVLDPANGLVLCETIIDSQAYSNTVYGSYPYYNNSSETVYANDYATSSIRAWLNADFYNTAFTASEKAYIQTTALNNDACNSQYDSAPTNDKVFLLSYADALNSAYGFSKNGTDFDAARSEKGSDYAKCQGLYVYNNSGSLYNGNSFWWLRTPGFYSRYACSVNYAGSVNLYDDVDYTFFGVRPALKLNLQSSIFESYNQSTKSDYAVFVVDSRGNAIEGVKVRWNSTEKTTGAEGAVIFNRFTVGEPTITAEKSGYQKYSNENTNYSKSDKGYDIITLYKNSEASLLLKSAYYKNNVINQDLLKGTKRLSTSNEDTLFDNGKFSISCVAQDKAKAARYELIQNKTVIKASTTGSFTDLSINSFGEGTGIKIRVYDAKNNWVDTKLNLEIVKDAAVAETSIKFGNKITISVADDVPFLGGTSTSFNIPDLPIEVYVSEDNVHIGLNLKLYDKNDPKFKIGDNFDTKAAVKEYAKKAKETMDLLKKVKGAYKSSSNYKDIKKNLKTILKQNKKMKVPAAGDVEITFLGYGEGKWNDNGFSTVSVNLYLMVDANVEKTWQTVVWVIPFVINIKVGVEGKLSAEGSYDFQSRTLSGDIKLNVKPHLEAFVGAGIGKVVSGGAYGEAELDTQFQLLGTTPSPGLNYIDLTGELGIKAYFLWAEHKRSFAHNTWHLYTRTTKSGTPEKASAMYTSGIYDTDSYSVSDLSYLANESAWLGQTASSQGKLESAASINMNEIKPLLTGTYRNAQPVVASAGSTAVMAYINADGSRDEYNAGALYYSVYSSGSWGDPIRVDSNATFDSAPYLYSDGTDIWLAYMDSSRTFTSADTLESTAAAQSVVVAKFNQASGKFENLTKVSTNGVFSSVPEITVVNGVPTVIWQANTSSDIFGLNATNSIMYSTFNGSTWSEATAYKTGLNSIVGFAAGSLGSSAAIAYIVDTDNNLETVDDRELYASQIGTAPVLVQSGTVSNPQFAIMPDTGHESLVWYSNGNLAATESFGSEGIRILNNDESLTITDSFEVVGDRIMFVSATSDSTNIFALTYNGESWNNPVALTAQNQYIENASFTKYGESIISVLTGKSVTVTADDVIDECELAWVSFSPMNSISLDNLYVDETTVIPGQEYSAEIDVTNLGDAEQTAFNVVINDENNATVFAQTVSETIKPGETKTLTVSLTADEIVTLKTLTATVNIADAAEADLSDNSATIKIGYANLVTEVEKYKVGNQNFAMVSVTNNGFTKTAATLELFNSLTNEALGEMDIEELENGETQFLRFNIDENTFGMTSGVLTAKVVSDVEELYTSDSEAQVAFDLNTEIVAESVSLDKSSLEIIKGQTATLTATVLPENASDKTVLWESSDESVATVDDNGKITAVAAGTAVITATTVSGGHVASADVDVEAQYFNIYWSVDGSVTTQRLEVGSAIILPTEPSKDGYTFTGWTPSVPSTMPANDLTFTAVFRPITYNAVFKADGVTIATVPYTVETESIIPPTVPEIIGYNGAWEYYELSIGGVTVNAVYTVKQFTAKWIVDGTETTQIYNYGATIQKPANPEKDGYTFKGWTPEVPATMPANDLKFTAVFEKIPDAISVTGVSVSHASKTLIVGGTQQLTATVAPANATNKTVTYTSSDTAVATVSATGLVTAKTLGTATITVTTADGNKTATCVVTVKKNEVVKVEILTLPNTVEYTYKSGSFNKTGLSIRAIYSNGDTETITDTSKINVTGFNAKQKGEQKLTVEFGGIQAEQKITVNVKYAWWQWLIMIFLFGWIWY